VNEKQIEMVKAAIGAGITSPKEIANFIAQISHESANLTRMEEGFRYTKGIDQIPVRSARREGDVVLEAARKEALDGKPERLAELMYGGRMGNNEPGDGFKYRGRGYMQLTGKDNYEAMGKLIGIDLVAKPELAALPENAAKIAVEFWKTNVPKDAREDVTKATTAINGGDNGLPERKKLYEELVKELTPKRLEEITKQIADKQASVTPNSDGQAQPTTVQVGNRQYTIVTDEKPTRIFATPEMTPPPLVELTRPTTVGEAIALLNTGIFPEKRDAADPSRTPGLDKLQPNIDQPRISR
jgi:putative chitinase